MTFLDLRRINVLSEQVNKKMDEFYHVADLIRRVSQLIEDHDLTPSETKDIFSQSQMESKSWLVDVCNEKNLDLKNVFLCGGWLATLVLHPRFRYHKLRNFDKDSKCKIIADKLHRSLIIEGWKYLSITEDINKINYVNHTFEVTRKDGTVCQLTESPDSIINTSCEHIGHFSEWYCKLPQNKLIILQSNNGFEIEGHVNCVRDLQEFETQTQMSQVIFSGQKEMHKFTRFMRIGYK